MIPNAFAEVYVNESPFVFSINYPSGWQVEKYDNFLDNGVSFMDEFEWKSTISVFYYDNLGPFGTDNVVMNEIKETEEDFCYDSSFEVDGYVCSDFQIQEEFIMEIDGYRSFTIIYSMTKEWNDPNFPGKYPMMGTTTEILVGNDVWEIISESDEYVFDKYAYDIGEAVASFRLTNLPTPPTIITPSFGTTYNVYFDELPPWATINIDDALNFASNYWYERDKVTFQRVDDWESSDFEVSWIKNYGHVEVTLGMSYAYLVDVGLGDDRCNGIWQPYSQQTNADTLAHELGHAIGYEIHTDDPSDIMSYSYGYLSYQYEKYNESLILGYAMAYPVCTERNGITYDYRINSSSDHRYDIFYVTSISEFEKFSDGDDFRNICKKSGVTNTSGTCKTNPGGAFVIHVVSGPQDELVEYEFVISETNLPPSESTFLPPSTTNYNPPIQESTETISTDQEFFEVYSNEFTTMSISGFIPEQLFKGQYPVYLTITFGGKIVSELKLPVTDQGYFNTPFQLAPNSPEGTYLIAGKVLGKSLGTTTFTIGKSNIIKPPSAIEYGTTFDQQTSQDQSPSFKLYSSNENGFSINYPSNWIYEENYVCFEIETCMFSLADDFDYWTVQVNVNFYENELEGYSYSTDKQYLDDVVDFTIDECTNSWEYYGYGCSDFKLIYAETKSINGIKSYEVQYSWKATYDDGSYEKSITTTTELPQGNDLWLIYSETLEEYKNYNSELIENSISSFKLKNAFAQETTGINSEYEPTAALECGEGTYEEDGKCVADVRGGGCLIATATYGSELATQVQQLREIRDNSLLQTESGTAFMESFNQFYYSFSPTIADLERENPIFKEVVKLTITPLLSSLSLLNYVDMDSESEVLGYGISLILLNVGMYFVLPVFVIHRIKKFV